MHKLVAKAFLMVFFLASVIFAQGVAITQPLDGLITSDVNQRVTYVFADPGSVDETSITLTVDAVDFIVGDPEITWTFVNFHYDIATAWAEGIHNLSITADDTIGDPLTGVPLVSDFVVDATGPYMFARTPGVVGELVPFTTTNIVQPVTIDIMDDLGFIDVSSIDVMIDGTLYGDGDPGVFITAITGGFRFEFYPDSAGITWPENYWVDVDLLAANDSPDYGVANLLVADPENAWGFWVDSDGPECSPEAPIPFFRPVAWTGCSDLELEWLVEDENGINMSTFSITINTRTYNWGDYRIAVDTLVINPYEWDTLGVPTAWYVTQALFTFNPNPQWYAGVNYTAYPPYIEDIYGNFDTGWYWGPYPWTSWQIMFDNVGPSVSNPFPTPGYITRDFEQEISFDVHDVYGGVDPTTLHLTISTPSMGTVEYPFWHPVSFPEISWDGTTFTYDPAAAGVTWPQGDTVTITVWDIMDSVEFCDANDMEHTPYVWTFYVADGPMIGEVNPGDDMFTACLKQPISFELLDPDGINPNTVVFQVEGIVFDITYESMTICTNWVGPIEVVETTVTFPFYEDTPGIFVLDLNLLLPGILEYEDAMEINCTILQAEDALGNPLWDGLYSWRFWADFSGPYHGDTYPADGGVAGGPYPTFSLDIHDGVCGMVDPAGVNVMVDGINYNPLIHPGVDWIDFPGGGTVTVNSSVVGRAWTHGAVIDVCLTQAFDLPQYKCDVWGNAGIDLPYCYSFTVDNNPPVPTIVQPLEGEVTACNALPIIIEVTDDYDVDPTWFQLVVNDIVYNWGDPRLVWDGTYLTYTPTSPYPEGTVVWTLARVGDIAGIVDDSSPISGATFIADYTGPEVVWTNPMLGEVVSRIPDEFKLGILDPSGVDVNSAQFIVEFWDADDTLPSFVFDITELTHPGAITFDPILSELWLDLALAGIDFGFEPWDVYVEVTGTDLPDYVCPDPNDMLYQFDFSVDQGWDVPIEFYVDTIGMDTIPPDDMYAFGAYVGATDEYDVGLDILLPPPPPTETPIAFLTPIAGTALQEDYRGLATEDWSWQMFTGSQTGCIHWDPADLPTLGSFVINDLVDMRGEEFYCFGPGELIDINVTREVMTLYSGWNLLSVPVIPDDPTIAVVFPMVDPLDVWEYTGGSPSYVHPTVVQPGHAYFILYSPGVGDPDPCYFSIPGAAITGFTRTVPEGWATLGSVYDFGGVPVADIVTVPSGAIEFDLVYYLDASTGGYMTDEKIVAAVGYWAFIDPASPFGSAELTVDATYRGGAKVIPAMVDDPDWTLDMVFDGTYSRTLTIGGLDKATADYDRGLDMPIPPALPGVLFDVFIEGGEYGRMAKDIRNGDGWTIVVSSIEPVEVSWTGDAPAGLVLEGMGVSIELDVEGNALLTPGVYTAKRRVDIPTEFALHAAAPNPFNGACAISFDVPNDTEVSIDIYDMLGHKVNALVNTDFEAGSHRVIWDGKDDANRTLPSGMYLYRMTADSFEASGRMVYLR